MRTNPRQLSILALALTSVAAVLTGVILYRDRIWNVVSSPLMIEVAIASTPSGADTFVEGVLIGKTPLKVPVKQGQRTVELKKAGYEDTSRVFYAANRPMKWQPVERELNIELKPSSKASTNLTNHPQSAHAESVLTHALAANPGVMKELRELRSMILANPNEAVTVTALQERVRLQSDEVKSLREDIREVKEQSRWFIGALVTVLIGVLASVVAVLQAVPKKRDDA